MAEHLHDRDLRGVRLERCDLSGAVLRGVEVDGVDLDSPWLAEGRLLVNGVDVVPLVEAELDRRFPGRSLRGAATPEGLREAWTALEAAWDALVARALTLDPALLERRVEGEWSFSETLRHLVMATDVWLRGAVLGVPRPYHPIGVPNAEFATDGHDTSVFSEPSPALTRVLEVRAGHRALVAQHLATLGPEELERTCPHPWAPGRWASSACSTSWAAWPWAGPWGAGA